MNSREITGVGDVVAARAFACVAEQHGEGSKALGSALRGAGGPIFGAIGWCEPLAVAGVGVGAGVEAENGDGGVPGVGGEVEGRAALSVDVAEGIKMGNERGPDCGGGSVANDAVEDALAAGVGNGGRW